MNSGSRDSTRKHELLLWAASDGAAAERHGDWSDAAAAYQEAADLQEELFEAQTTRTFAERQLGNVPDLTSRLAYSYGIAAAHSERASPGAAVCAQIRYLVGAGRS